MVKSCTSTTLMIRDVADSLHRTVLNMLVWKGLHPAFIAFEEQKKNGVFAESSEGNTTASTSAGPPAGARQEFAPPISPKLAG